MRQILAASFVHFYDKPPHWGSCSAWINGLHICKVLMVLALCSLIKLDKNYRQLSWKDSFPFKNFKDAANVCQGPVIKRGLILSKILFQEFQRLARSWVPIEILFLLPCQTICQFHSGLFFNQYSLFSSNWFSNWRHFAGGLCEMWQLPVKFYKEIIFSVFFSCS